jgi:hypothetical protein
MSRQSLNVTKRTTNSADLLGGVGDEFLVASNGGSS